MSLYDANDVAVGARGCLPISTTRWPTAFGPFAICGYFGGTLPSSAERLISALCRILIMLIREPVEDQAEFDNGLAKAALDEDREWWQRHLSLAIVVMMEKLASSYPSKPRSTDGEVKSSMHATVFVIAHGS
ncbi:hypothetical protein AAL_08237 [Moelleriella libera RCEF 2490]|uniref:Uncharacterized protein n=1 Tax=Moelleriella libera RCEF 2490 TaxID=1081109 RepID=A0A167VRL6_9HYPO|nr:hypothetical protein AAL_08237 [Moelleriella libera RCEF 2490]